MSSDDGKQGIRSKTSRVLGLAGVLVAAALVQGCGGNSGTQIGVSWSLTENGAPVSCAPGDQVDIRVDTDAMTVEGLPCSALRGVTPAVTCGVNHFVAVALLDSHGTVLSLVPEMSLFVPCGVGVQNVNVVFDVGSCGPSAIKTSWILTENGAQVQCSPGDEVDLIVDAMTATFPCEAKQGTTPATVTGGVNHNVSLKLFDKDGVLLSQTGVMSLAVACNSVTNTPQVDFSLTP